MKAYYGKVHLPNGLIINWMRFANSEAEAIHEVVAQHVYVDRCYTEAHQ